MSKRCTKTKGPNWTEQETRYFLELCVEKQILKLMESKKYKHVDIFKRLVSSMSEKGFNKTPEQMKLKLKKLKQDYSRCKENNSKSGVSPTICQFYNEIDLLYSLRPTFEAVSTSEDVDTTIDFELNDDSNEPDSEHSSTSIADDTIEFVKIECDLGEGTSNDYDTSNNRDDTVCETPEPPKRRRPNPQGRKGFQTFLIQYSNSFLERQQSIITKIVSEQTRQQKEIFDSILKEQREWVKEILDKEHKFQKQQMETMLQTFSQWIERANQQPCVNQLPRAINFKQPTTFAPSDFPLRPCPMINISQTKGNPQTTCDEKTDKSTKTFDENEEQTKIDKK